MNTYYIPDLLRANDTLYLEDIADYMDEEWAVPYGSSCDEYLNKGYLEGNFGKQLDKFRNSSFWILENGKLYPIREGCHGATARFFISDAGYIHTEDSLSETAVRYSEWLKLRLPSKGVTDRQRETLEGMVAHKHYRLFMETLHQ